MRHASFIVNADDYGRDEESTRAILECFKHGFVHRTTLMVNMAYSGAAVDLSRKYGIFDKVGLHLNLTQGKPLTDGIRAFAEFCDDAGCFKTHLVGCLGHPLTTAMKHAVSEEVRAQARRYLAFGFPLKHCDGHHHVHARLGLYPIVIPILQELGFRSIRNRYTVQGPLWRGVRGRWWKFRYERTVWNHGLKTTAAFGGWDGELLDKWHRFGSVELMVHPHYDVTGALVNVTDFHQMKGPRMEGLCVRQS